MALDIGDKKIGIALSDPLKITSQGLETYERKDSDDDFHYLAKIIEDNQVATLVAGLPKNMDGSEGPQAEKVRDFVDQLSRFTDVEIEFFDERLTTVEAERMLISGNVSRRKRKKVIDKLAANLILQNYLQRYY